VGVIIERFGGYRFGLLFLAIMPFLGAVVLFGWSRRQRVGLDRQPHSYRPTSV
jgi:hypothetical protein